MRACFAAHGPARLSALPSVPGVLTCAARQAGGPRPPRFAVLDGPDTAFATVGPRGEPCAACDANARGLILDGGARRWPRRRGRLPGRRKGGA